jgi:hypothetical protein
MIVVHFTKISTLYQRVLISTLAKRLENLLFAILYTFFGIWSRDHYMPLQKFALLHVMHCYGFLTESPSCNAKVSPTQAPLAPCESQAKNCVIPHSTEQDTLPIVFLISKQVLSYQTHGSIGCSREAVSTPKNRSLANYSMTNHIS